jgi:competence protein ComEC
MKPRTNSRIVAAVAIALVACFPRGGGAEAAKPEARGGALTVRFLDVGQGDAALLTTSDKHAMLIDAGPPDAASRVASALASIAGDTLDAVLLSHAHADHLGDLAHLAFTLPLERWIDPGYAAHAVPSYARVLDALHARHIPTLVARRGDRFALGADVSVSVLEPRDPLFDHTRSDLNANSVVVRIDHRARSGTVRFLFEGDAEHPTERRLLDDDRAAVRADVLKVAHHGSRHASSAAMLDAVAPKLAVISCGLGNDYGHPSAQTLRRLALDHATIARTDLEGDVTVTSDDSGLHWTVARSVPPEDLLVPGVEKPGAEAP